MLYLNKTFWKFKIRILKNSRMSRELRIYAFVTLWERLMAFRFWKEHYPESLSGLILLYCCMGKVIVGVYVYNSDIWIFCQ